MTEQMILEKVIREYQKTNALLREALERSTEWLENAPVSYANGNVAQGTDEGEYYGWKGHNEIVEHNRTVLEETK